MSNVSEQGGNIPFLVSLTNVFDMDCKGDSFWCYHAKCPLCGKNNRVAYVQKSGELRPCFEDLCGHLKPLPNRRGDFLYGSRLGDSLRWEVLENPLEQ